MNNTAQQDTMPQAKDKTIQVTTKFEKFERFEWPAENYDTHKLACNAARVRR